MAAVRAEAPVFAEAVTVTVPLFEPETGETVSHVGSLLLTVQDVLEVIVNVCCCPSAAKFKVFGDTVRVGFVVPATCVTLIVRVVTPVPFIVTMAFRAVLYGFAAAVTVTVPLFAPEAGETVSHVGSLLLTVQAVLDEIVNDCC